MGCYWFIGNLSCDILHGFINIPFAKLLSKLLLSTSEVILVLLLVFLAALDCTSGGRGAGAGGTKGWSKTQGERCSSSGAGAAGALIAFPSPLVARGFTRRHPAPFYLGQ